MKKFLFFTTALLIALSMVACENGDSSTVDRVSSQEETTVSSIETTVEETTPSWREELAPELVEDIEKAFTEIGENPNNIVSIEYVSIRETDLFDRRDYKITFDKGSLSDALDEDERPWRHSLEYRITTEEWHEGEPEREQYPREYLVTIKFWSDDNNTNINQWTHTGNGKLQ